VPLVALRVAVHGVRLLRVVRGVVRSAVEEQASAEVA
jgi:hypothetical protein